MTEFIGKFTYLIALAAIGVILLEVGLDLWRTRP